jgi:putative salt-induced outer membrane protein YdiY
MNQTTMNSSFQPVMVILCACLAASSAVAQETAHWTHEASVSITGKSGNTDKADATLKLKSAVSTENSSTELYGSYQYGKTTLKTADPANPGKFLGNSEKTADEIIAGVRYTRKITDTTGWYVRDEAEKDPFEAIDLRNTVAAGFTYAAWSSPKANLSLNGGLSHRLEQYEVGDDLNAAGLDLGLKHQWQFADWGSVNTTISYTPTFEDFGNYRISHISDLDIPLGTSNAWKLRLSLDNQYNSTPSGFQDKLDTTYLVSLLLSWK